MKFLTDREDLELASAATPEMAGAQENREKEKGREPGREPGIQHPYRTALHPRQQDSRQQDNSRREIEEQHPPNGDGDRTDRQHTKRITGIEG